MKKAILPVVISILVVISLIVWMVNDPGLKSSDNIQFIIILLLVIFGFYFGYRRITSEKRGEPAEDELSKKVLQKAAALSYYLSLYLWLVIMYLTDKLKNDPEVMFGWGILGMGIIFAISWLFYNFRGIRDA